MTSPPSPPPAPSPGSRDSSEPGTSPGSLVAARMLNVQVALLARVLASVLAAALPESMVQVEYVRSFADVLRRRDGQAIGVRVTAGDVVLGFRSPEVGVSEAYISHVVRGVTLSTDPVSMQRWLATLADVLDSRAERDRATATALQRFLDART